MCRSPSARVPCQCGRCAACAAAHFPFFALPSASAVNVVRDQSLSPKRRLFSLPSLTDGRTDCRTELATAKRRFQGLSSSLSNLLSLSICNRRRRRKSLPTSFFPCSPPPSLFPLCLPPSPASFRHRRTNAFETAFACFPCDLTAKSCYEWRAQESALALLALQQGGADNSHSVMVQMSQIAFPLRSLLTTVTR